MMVRWMIASSPPTSRHSVEKTGSPDAGRLAWVEKSALGGAKTVMVKADASVIRQQPRADAEVVFHAERGLLLEIAGEADPYGWLRVRHADGLAGWLPAHEAWGR